MTDEPNVPSWIAPHRESTDRKISSWYKPDDGPLDGVLIWRGQQESQTSGDVYNAYAIRVGNTGKVVGVSERAGLRDLRSVRVGSRVFIRPTGEKALASGRKMHQFEIFAEQLEPLSEPVRGGGNREGGAPSDGGVGASDKVPF